VDRQGTVAQKDCQVMSSCARCSIMLHWMDATSIKSREYVIEELSGFLKNTSQRKLSAPEG